MRFTTDVNSALRGRASIFRRFAQLINWSRRFLFVAQEELSRVFTSSSVSFGILVVGLVFFSSSSSSARFGSFSSSLSGRRTSLAIREFGSWFPLFAPRQRQRVAALFLSLGAISQVCSFVSRCVVLRITTQSGDSRNAVSLVPFITGRRPSIASSSLAPPTRRRLRKKTTGTHARTHRRTHTHTHARTCVLRSFVRARRNDGRRRLREK